VPPPKATALPGYIVVVRFLGDVILPGHFQIGPLPGHALGLLPNQHHQIGRRVQHADIAPPRFAQRKQRFSQWIADFIYLQRFRNQTQTRAILQQIAAALFL